MAGIGTRTAIFLFDRGCCDVLRFVCMKKPKRLLAVAPVTAEFLAEIRVVSAITGVPVAFKIREALRKWVDEVKPKK